MSIIFILLFLLPFIASGLAIDKDDEKTLLKMKKQLGDPPILSSWFEGYDFCGNGFFQGGAPMVVTDCNSNGRISKLILGNIDLTAPFPDAICDLTELDYLALTDLPGLYGPIPSCVTKLAKVVYFFIIGTSISGPVPNFYNNTKIFNINLSNNQLSGPIPSSISTLNLTVLNLSWNHLTGTLPPDLFHGFTVLFLSHNNLTGEIPKTYGSIHFIIFDVGYNNLSGDASFLFGKQKYAHTIVLAKNNFEFDLSYVEFSDNLDELDLSHNKIYGKVPDSLATAGGLWVSQPNLSCNRLCGELPQGKNMQLFKAEDFADNECLCGSPLPPCSN